MIQLVGTIYDDDRFDGRNGWRFQCELCMYRSPVMAHKDGAEHWRDWHLSTEHEPDDERAERNAGRN